MNTNTNEDWRVNTWLSERGTHTGSTNVAAAQWTTCVSGMISYMQRQEIWREQEKLKLWVYFTRNAFESIVSHCLLFMIVVTFTVMSCFGKNCQCITAECKFNADYKRFVWENDFENHFSQEMNKAIKDDFRFTPYYFISPQPVGVVNRDIQRVPDDAVIIICLMVFNGLVVRLLHPWKPDENQNTESPPSCKNHHRLHCQRS